MLGTRVSRRVKGSQRVGTTCSGGKQDTRRGVRLAFGTSVAGLRDASHPSHVSLTPPPAHGACPVAPGVSGLPPCTGGSPRPGKRPHLAGAETELRSHFGEISAQFSGPRFLCASRPPRCPLLRGPLPRTRDERCGVCMCVSKCVVSGARVLGARACLMHTRMYVPVHLHSTRSEPREESAVACALRVRATWVTRDPMYVRRGGSGGILSARAGDGTHGR